MINPNTGEIQTVQYSYPLSHLKYGARAWSYILNGEEIPEASIQMVSELANSLTLLRYWKDNDILLIDNYRVMHGRKPYSGEKDREVLVSLTN